MKKKKILITGAEGFIGFHLVSMLDMLDNFEVFASYKKLNKKLLSLKNISLFKLDIRNFHQVKKLLLNIKPDIVVNLAAMSVPMFSWKYIKYTFNTNLYGTLHFLNCQKNNIFEGKLLLASTSGQYGYSLLPKEKVSEKSTMTPCHPYGISKLAAELLALNFYKNYNSKVIFARIFNTTGPFKTNDLISDIGFRVKNKLVLNPSKFINLPVGNLYTRRAYLHVNDTINALLKIINSNYYGEAFNISNSIAYSGYDVIKAYEKLLKIKINPISKNKYIRKNDEKIIIGDTRKIFKKLGWSPKTSLDQIISDVYKSI